MKPADQIEAKSVTAPRKPGAIAQLRYRWWRSDRIRRHNNVDLQGTDMGKLTSLLVRAPVDVFATGLADDIAKRYPTALDQQPGKRPSVNRLTRIVEDVCAKGVAFQVEHKLGWLGKAQLGNAFRWSLQEMGYHKDFVDFATEAFVVHVSKGQAPAPAK